MCARAFRKTPAPLLADAFGAACRSDLEPDYNIAPTDPLCAVRLDEDATRELVTLRWGLLPFWEKNPRNAARRINARAETVSEKPAFRKAFRDRRCLIVVDGFYEWRREGKLRFPQLYQLIGGGPLAFAGLWERWGDKEAPLETGAVITTEANDLLAAIHDRMPVILDEEAQRAWLDPTLDEPALRDLLRPLRADAMETWELDRKVNNVRAAGPELIAPPA